MSNRNGKWQDLVNQCLDEYEDIKKSSERSRKITLIKESHRIYDLREIPASFPWEGACSIVQPLCTITIDNMEPRIASGFTGREPYVNFDVTGVTDNIEPYKFLQEWFTKELKETVDIENVVSRMIHTLLLEGTVFMAPRYVEDYEKHKDFVYDANGNIKTDKEGTPYLKEVEDRIFRGVKVDFIPFEDIYIPDKIENWEDINIIRKVNVTYRELQELSKEDDSYRNIGKWLLAEEEPEEETGKEVIECLEYHVKNYVYKKENQSKEDITNWDSKDYVALIALNSGTLIRLIELQDINLTGQHMIRRIRLFPEYGKAYGKCLYEKMKPIQDGATDGFNIMMNSAYVELIPWFFYSNKTGLPSELQLYPGRGIEVDNPKEVVFPRTQNKSIELVKLYEVWVTLWEKLGSIGNLQTGLPSQKTDTATETMAVIQEGNIRHNYQAKIMKKEFIDFLRLIYDLYYRYMPFEETFIYQGKPMLIPRKLMRRRIIFRLTGSSELSNAIMELRKTEQMYSMLRPDPRVNPDFLIKRLVAAMEPDANLDEVLVQQSPQAQMLEGLQQMQGQGQGPKPGQIPQSAK